MNWKIKAVGKGFYKTTGPSRCRLWPWLWLRLRCWQWLWVKIIMSRAIKREPKSPICVVGIGIKSWLNCLEKLSFFGCWKSLSAASKCRKTHPCDYRISKFSGGACPQIPPKGGSCQFFARVSNSVALLFKTLMNPLLMGSLIVSALLYACETWSLIVDIQKKLQATEMRCFGNCWHLIQKPYH